MTIHNFQDLELEWRLLRQHVLTLHVWLRVLCPQWDGCPGAEAAGRPCNTVWEQTPQVHDMFDFELIFDFTCPETFSKWPSSLVM